MSDHVNAQALTSEEAPTDSRHPLRDIVETVVLALVLYAALRLFIRNFRIEGTSMEPNLHDGQHVIISKWSYWLKPVDRGEVIVFRAPSANEHDLVKRVVGLPGEHVAMRNGQVFIDGQLLLEPYARQAVFSGGPWVLGDDEVFVLGDNRGRSQDSRSWGPLPISRIIGRGLISYWPPQHWGPVSHYTYPERPDDS